MIVLAPCRRLAFSYKSDDFVCPVTIQEGYSLFHESINECLLVLDCNKKVLQGSVPSRCQRPEWWR